MLSLCRWLELSVAELNLLGYLFVANPIMHGGGVEGSPLDIETCIAMIEVQYGCSRAAYI